MGDFNRMSNKQCRAVSQDEIKYIESFIKDRIKSRTGREILYLSYGPPKDHGDGPRNIICHLCGVDSMITAADLQDHLNGNRHRTNLGRDVISRTVYRPYKYIYAYENGQPVFFWIQPGENVPCLTSRWQRRFENPSQKRVRFKQLPMCRLRSDPAIHFDIKYPLLGLDYILLTDDRVVFCFLCDGFFETNIYEHVSSIDHEHKYIIKHFPNMHEKAKSLLRISDYIKKKRLIHHIFRELYGRIAKKRGRKRVYTVVHNEFVNKLQIYKDQALMRLTPFHENTLDYDKMEKILVSLVNECHKHGDNIGFYPPHIPDLIGGGASYEVEKKLFWKETSKIEVAYKLKIPNRAMYEDAKQKDLAELKSKYKQYDDLPESHPDYKDVWKAYYIKTCEMLKRDRIRIEDHDFERNWFPHWDKYKEEAFRKEWETIKANLKKSLNISPNAESPDASPDREDFASEITGGPDLTDIEDYEVDSDWVPDNQQLTNKPADLLGVLRILSALENYLGSLGPKCMELLGQAIIKEKNNQLDEMLIDNVNLIYFATVKEKLKGLLVTKSIAPEAVNRVEVLIEDINNLIEMMERYKDMHEYESYNFRSKSKDPSALNNYQINPLDSIVQEANMGEDAFRGNSRPVGKNRKIDADLNRDLRKFDEILEQNNDLNCTNINIPDVAQNVNIGSRSQYEPYQEYNPEQQFRASNPQQLPVSNPQQNFSQGATDHSQKQGHRQSTGNSSYLAHSKADGHGYFGTRSFDDRFRDIGVQNDISEGWNRNFPEFDNDDRNYRRSSPERSDWRDPKTESQRYSASSNFNPKRDLKADTQMYHELSDLGPEREPNTLKNGSDDRYKSYERGTSDSEFRREYADDRFRGNVQNYVSDDLNRNCPQFDEYRNHRRSATERSGWRDPQVENERYPEPSKFEPKREFNISRYDSDGRNRGHERGTSDAEFRRERPGYQRSREPSNREDRDHREPAAHRYEMNRPMESRPRSRSRSWGYNNESGRSRNNSRQTYGYSRESRRH